MTDGTKTSGLSTQRAAAGARYAAAISELKSALIDLAAIDVVLQQQGSIPDSQTFHNYPDSLPWEFQHPLYAPRHPDPMNPVLQDWHKEVAARRDQLQNGLSK
jgi:hypothetical protein